MMFGIGGGMRNNAFPALQKAFWTVYVMALVVSSLTPVDLSGAPADVSGLPNVAVSRHVPVQEF